MASGGGSALQQTGFFYKTTIRNVQGDFDQYGNRSPMLALETKLQVPNLPPLRIPGEQSDFVDVLVAFVEDTNKLYVQLRNESKTIQDICDAMGRLYGTLKDGELDFINPDRGDLCAARYTADGCWYRACVIKRTSMRNIQVFFVDYGNTADVPKTDIKQLADVRLKQIPPQAICVKFAKVTATPHTAQRIREALEDRNVCIRLESVTADYDAYVVSMGYDDNGKDIYINDAVAGKVPLPTTPSAASAYVPDDKQQARNVPARTMPAQVPVQQRNGAAPSNGVQGTHFSQQSQPTTARNNFAGGRDAAAFGAGGGASGFQSTNQNAGGFGSTNQNRGGPPATNQSAGGFGSTNQNAGGFGSTNQNRGPPATNQSAGGFGSTNHSRGEPQATNQNSSGFGGPQVWTRSGSGGQFGSDGGSSGAGNFRQQNSAGRVCRSCNQEGHFQRDCPSAGPGGPTKCFNCNGEGHKSHDCPEPSRRRPQQGGGGGGGNFGASGGASGFGSATVTGSRFGGRLPPPNGQQQSPGFGGSSGGFGGQKSGGFNATNQGAQSTTTAPRSPAGGFGSTSAFATPSAAARSPPTRTARTIARIADHLPLTIGSVHNGMRSDGAISDPDLFYVQVEASFPKLDEFDIKAGTLPLTAVRPGTACVALFDGDWYRAEVVEKVDDSTVEVLFVDYGNKETRKVAEVFSLTDEQSQMVQECERVAFPCRLAGVLPLNADGYNEAAKELIQQIEEVTITIKSKSVKNIYGVELVVKATGQSFADLLVDRGLAQKFQFNQSPVVENERVKVSRCDGADTAVDRFSVQMISWYDEIDQMGDAIKSGTRPLYNPTVGQVCVAQYENCWYRGEVTTLRDDDDKVAVLFVDYGNTEWKNPAEVYELDRDEQDPLVIFCRRLSVLCRLKGVRPPHGSAAWSDEAHEKWAELVEEGAELEAVFDEVDDRRRALSPRPVCIYLKDAMSGDELTVAQQLVFAELAEMGEPEEVAAVGGARLDNSLAATARSGSSVISEGELITADERSIDKSTDSDAAQAGRQRRTSAPDDEEETAVTNHNSTDDETYEDARVDDDKSSNGETAAAGLVRYADPVVDLGKSYDGIRLDAGDGVATPSHFYVLFTKDDDLQTQIGNEIKPGRVLLANPTPGTPCLATYDDAWYRAELVSVNEAEGSGSVLFVDYGNLTTKPLSELYVLGADQTELIRTAPRLIIPCQLYGICHKDDWTDDDIAAFSAMTVDDSDTDELKDKVLTVFVTGAQTTNGTYPVLLKDKDTDVSLAKLLIDANIAVTSNQIFAVAAAAAVDEEDDAQVDDGDSLDDLLNEQLMEEELEGVELDDADEVVTKADVLSEAIASLSASNELVTAETNGANEEPKDVLQSDSAADDEANSVVSDRPPPSLDGQAAELTDEANVSEAGAAAEDEEMVRAPAASSPPASDSGDADAAKDDKNTDADLTFDSLKSLSPDPAGCNTA